MKPFASTAKHTLTVALLALTAGPGTHPSVAQEDNPKQQEIAETDLPKAYTVAVLPFDAGSKNLKDLVPQMADLVHLHLSTHDQLALVERFELDKILSELELGHSGTVSANTAAKIGHLAGDQILVTGRVFAVQNELYVVTKIIGVETGKVFGEFVSFSFKKSHDDACKSLANKIASSITKKGDGFFLAVQDDDPSLVESLMVLAEGKDLPTVSVTVDERHIGRPAVDPAAETEISLLLQKLGFDLVEAATTTTPPDIELRGEAFSEFALRKGNLVSCKARVEIKAVERLTGRIIAVDRQTDVAVDVSEQIAAKSAIQKAAEKLAERVILRIIQSIDQDN